MDPRANRPNNQGKPTHPHVGHRCAHLDIVAAQSRDIAELQMKGAHLEQEKEGAEMKIKVLRSSVDHATRHEGDHHAMVAMRIIRLLNAIGALSTIIQDVAIPDIPVDDPGEWIQEAKEALEAAGMKLDKAKQQEPSEFFKWLALAHEEMLLFARLCPESDTEGQTDDDEDLPELKDSDNGDST